MAIFEEAFELGGITTAVVVGVGVLVLAPVLLPVVRPVAKAAIKAGVVAYDQARETVWELGEGFEDLVAEARAELAAAPPEPPTRRAPPRPSP